MSYNSHTRKLTLFKGTVSDFKYITALYNNHKSLFSRDFFFPPNLFLFLSFKNCMYLIFGCFGSLLLCESYSLVVVRGQVLSARASAVAGCGFGRTGSRCQGFSSCRVWVWEDNWAQLLAGMWNLTEQGLNQVQCIGRQILYHGLPGKSPNLFPL